MKYIDLHTHSNMSDGTASPDELVKHAAKAGLHAIALTDHDTVAGIKEAETTAALLKEKGVYIRIVPGVEISAAYQSKDIHILGLLIDPENEILLRALDVASKDREERNKQMIKNFVNAGIPMTLEALYQGVPDTVITRAHFARFLIRHHYAKDNVDAFNKYLGYDSPFYVKRKYMTPEHAISLIKKANGIPVLAHPLLYKLSIEKLEELIVSLKSNGLVGIETIYSANINFDEGIVRRLANKYKLIMTGGSDYHGTNKPHIEIGIGKGNLKIPVSILEHLDVYKESLKNNLQI